MDQFNKAITVGEVSGYVERRHGRVKLVAGLPGWLGLLDPLDGRKGALIVRNTRAEGEGGKPDDGRGVKRDNMRVTSQITSSCKPWGYLKTSHRMDIIILR